MNQKIKKTEEEWKQILTEEEFVITRKKSTEKAFTGKYYNTKEKGNYHCICCGQLLFSSEHKYDSGSGWPSFYKPTHQENISKEIDQTHGMERIEVLCSLCDAHLGHVFQDGPQPTGTRYCINSSSLKLKPS